MVVIQSILKEQKTTKKTQILIENMDCNCLPSFPIFPNEIVVGTDPFSKIHEMDIRNEWSKQLQ